MAGGFPGMMRHGVGRLGAAVLTEWDGLRHAAAVIGTALAFSVRPRYWLHERRQAFAQQIMVIGINSLLSVGGVAFLVGIAVVVHLASWGQIIGESNVLGRALVIIVARGLGPLLVGLIIIVRDGSVIAAELGIMRVDGRIQTLEAQGGSPFFSLVLPRVLGVAISEFCLTVVFIWIAFISGWLVGALTGKGHHNPLILAGSVLGQTTPRDLFAVLGMSILPGLYTAASCCIAGLEIDNSLAEVPGAIQRAMIRSVFGLFVIATVVMLLVHFA